VTKSKIEATKEQV